MKIITTALLIIISTISKCQDTIYFDKISINIQDNVNEYDLFGYWTYNDTISTHYYEGLSKPFVYKGKLHNNVFTYYDKWYNKNDIVFMTDGRVLLFKANYYPEYYVFYPFNYKKIRKIKF